MLAAMVETGAITPPRPTAPAPSRRRCARRRETPPGTNYFVDMVAAEAERLAGAPATSPCGTTLNLRPAEPGRGRSSAGASTRRAKKNVGQARPGRAWRRTARSWRMVGGRDYEDSQFNRATQAKRQAGSLFKLFVYLAALRERASRPRRVLVDRPIQIGDWEPQNYGGRFRGRCRCGPPSRIDQHGRGAARRRGRHPGRHRHRAPSRRDSPTFRTCRASRSARPR